MRYLYRVHLEGAWVRDEDGAEWSMHSAFRVASAREGFSLEFRMARNAIEHVKDGRHIRQRHGTFVASGIMVLASNPHKAVTRAQAYLREFVGDLVCTSPRIVFDRDMARTYFDRSRTVDRRAA